MKTNIDKDAPRVITDTAQTAHRVNVANGWWGDRNDIAVQGPEGRAIVILAALGLVTSEVAEASRQSENTTRRRGATPRQKTRSPAS